MLSPQEMQEIETEFPRYERKQAVCLEALKIVQRHRGWVPNDAVRDIADFIGLTAEEVDSLATFYPYIFRKPLGKHLVMVCTSISCWIMGSDLIVKHLQKRLGIGFGETSADGRFTLLPSVCLGVCDHAPAIVIDYKRYDDLDPQKLDEILDNLT